MIEHGHGCRDRRRMAVRQVDRAGPKLDLLGRRCEPGNERDAGGDVFGLVGGMLPDIRFGKAELIRQQEASRSSRSDCRQSLSRGWIGIVKKPSFMILLLVR